MDAKVTITITQIIAIISGVLVPVIAALVYVYKASEAKNKEILELTKSFISSTNDSTKAIENNTRVIKELPDTIMMHIKAATKK